MEKQTAEWRIVCLVFFSFPSFEPLSASPGWHTACALRRKILIEPAGAGSGDFPSIFLGRTVFITLFGAQFEVAFWGQVAWKALFIYFFSLVPSPETHVDFCSNPPHSEAKAYQPNGS